MTAKKVATNRTKVKALIVLITPWLTRLGRAARWVGRTLGQLPPDTRLPWHRVLAKGRVDGTARIALSGAGADEQRALLRSEGVEVSAEGTVDLSRYGRGQ